MDKTSKATAKQAEAEAKKNQQLAKQVAELEERLKAQERLEKNPVVSQQADPPQPPQSSEVKQLMEKLEAAVAKVDKLERENLVAKAAYKDKRNKRKHQNTSGSSQDDDSSGSEDSSKYLTTADGTVVSRINVIYLKAIKTIIYVVHCYLLHALLNAQKHIACMPCIPPQFAIRFLLRKTHCV